MIKKYLVKSVSKMVLWSKVDINCECRIWNQNLGWILMDSGVHHSRAFCHFATHAALSTKQVGFHFSFLLRKCTVDLAKIPRKNADHTWKLQAYVTNMRQVHFFIEFAVFPFANRLISLERKIHFPFNILHFCSPLLIFVGLWIM